MYCHGHDGFWPMQGRFHTTRGANWYSDWPRAFQLRNAILLAETINIEALLVFKCLFLLVASISVFWLVEIIETKLNNINLINPW